MLRINGALALSLVIACPYAGSQTFPSKPLRMIVGFPPGGGVDTSARLVAARLPEYLGQQVVVDNRPGAGGAIAAALVAGASPDGYTLMVMSGTTLTQTLLTKVRYDLLGDFAAITLVSVSPLMVVVHPAVPASNVRQLIDYARAHPGKLNFASSGSGGLLHLAGELMQSMAGIKMTHIPYKGMVVAYPDLFSGQVQVGFANAISGMQHVRSGRVKILGVTSKSRMKILPDLPTLHESGLTGYNVTQWSGLVGPARIPQAVVARINGDVTKVLARAELAQQMASDGTEPAGGTPAEFGTHLRNELDMWGTVIKRAGIKVE